ncbi:hypothetical protein T484DRAFT_1886724, partial [Baffinella frigidus]
MGRIAPSLARWSRTAALLAAREANPCVREMCARSVHDSAPTALFPHSTGPLGSGAWPWISGASRRAVYAGSVPGSVPAGARGHAAGGWSGDDADKGVPARAVRRRSVEKAKRSPAGDEMFTVCEREFDSKELTMHIGRCKTVAELADIVTENGGRLNEIHLSALWGGLAWMRAQRGGAEDAGVRVYLVLLTREQVPNISARNTANILHAMAKLHLKGEQSENLADLLVRRAMETVSDLRPRDAAMLMHGLANLGVKSRAVSDLFRGVQPQPVDRAGQSDARFQMFGCVQPQLVERVGESDAQTVANAVWALATAGEAASPAFLSAMQA